MIVVLVLSACVTSVSFQNAKLASYDPPPENVRSLFAKPAGKGPFPAVVLLHTCGGVRPHVSADWPAFLTEIGYAVLTVDTFGSRGAGTCSDANVGTPAMTRDAYGALDYLAARPDIDPDRIGVMGFSLGAYAIEGFAPENINSPGGRNFKAGIAVYGNCSVSNKPSFPALQIIGDKDGSFRQSLCKPNKYWSVEIIPGAYHAFDQIVSRGGTYDSTATKKAHEITRKFLATHLAR
jgi:dienelactone hydrolase